MTPAAQGLPLPPRLCEDVSRSEMDTRRGKCAIPRSEMTADLFFCAGEEGERGRKWWEGAVMANSSQGSGQPKPHRVRVMEASGCFGLTQMLSTSVKCHEKVSGAVV